MPRIKGRHKIRTFRRPNSGKESENREGAKQAQKGGQDPIQRRDPNLTMRIELDWGSPKPWKWLCAILLIALIWTGDITAALEAAECGTEGKPEQQLGFLRRLIGSVL